MAKEFSYEIVEEIGVLSQNSRGWQKELNLVSWNGIHLNLIYGIGLQTMKRWGKVSP